LTKSQRKKYPHKHTLNLYVKKRPKNPPGYVFLTILVIVVILRLFTQYAVLDRLLSVQAAREQLAGQQARLEELEAALTDYDRVSEDYHRYTDAYLPEDLVALVDRGDVLSLVYTSASYGVFITSLSIAGDAVSVGVTAPTLAEISAYERTVASSEFVASTETRNASTNNPDADGETSTVSATLMITLVQGEGGTQ
jgi:Tfp pilus assembly protein PilN